MSMSAQEYLKKALPIMEQRQGPLHANKALTPLPQLYHPELDKSTFLSHDDVKLYQNYIGTLHWEVKLGRIIFASLFH